MSKNDYNQNEKQNQENKYNNSNNEKQNQKNSNYFFQSYFFNLNFVHRYM